MNVALFINYYQDSKPNRQKEIDACLLQNIKCNELNTCIVIVSIRDKNKLIDLLTENVYHSLEKVMIKVYSKIPTYNDWFTFTQKYSTEDTINCIANSDICFDDLSLKKLKDYPKQKNDCFALTRWDIVSIDKIKDSVFFDRTDSQDIWIRKGTFKNIEGADFTLGIAGCDNKIAHLLNKTYNLKNPSLSIKTYHLHNTNVRNYINFSHVERLPPPYFTINPSL